MSTLALVDFGTLVDVLGWGAIIGVVGSIIFICLLEIANQRRR